MHSSAYVLDRIGPPPPSSTTRLRASSAPITIATPAWLGPVDAGLPLDAAHPLASIANFDNRPSPRYTPSSIGHWNPPTPLALSQRDETRLSDQAATTASASQHGEAKISS